MKLLKKIIILIIIALIIQSSVLLFLEKYYFEVDSHVIVPKLVKKEQKSVVIKVSAESEEFKISYDGVYLSFFEGNQLSVVNTVLGTIEKVEIEENSTISFYKWLPDSNKIIYAEKVLSKNGVLIKFFYYDVNNKSSEEIRGNSAAIEDSNTNSQITDIIWAPLSNVMYVKLTKIAGPSLIYKLENMSTMNKTKIPLTLVGNIQVTPKDGILYYEDLNSKEVKNSLGNIIKIHSVDMPALLGSDNDNNIYIGDVENSKVVKIYWGMINGSLNYKELKTPTDIENMLITPEGKVYINDESKKVVTELNSGVETYYPGELKCMYDKGITSIEDEKVIKTPFKQ